MLETTKTVRFTDYLTDIHRHHATSLYCRSTCPGLCSALEFFVAAVVKISADVAHRAVPLRWLSLLTQYPRVTDKRTDDRTDERTDRIAIDMSVSRSIAVLH